MIALHQQPDATVHVTEDGRLVATADTWDTAYRWLCRERNAAYAAMNRRDLTDAQYAAIQTTIDHLTAAIGAAV